MLLDLLFLFSCFVSCFLALFSHSNTLCKVCFKTQYNKIKLTCLLKRHLAWWPSGAAASALLIGQFNLAESGCCSEGFPPYKWHRGSREGTPTLSFTFFPASAIFLHLSLSLPLSSLHLSISYICLSIFSIIWFLRACCSTSFLIPLKSRRHIKLPPLSWFYPFLFHSFLSNIQK